MTPSFFAALLNEPNSSTDRIYFICWVLINFSYAFIDIINFVYITSWPIVPVEERRREHEKEN